MLNNPIVSRFKPVKQVTRGVFAFYDRVSPSDLHRLFEYPEKLPAAVRRSPLALRCLDLLGPLDWTHFPERDLSHHWEPRPVRYAPFAAACLIKLEHNLVSMGALRRYLLEHPVLVSLLGFDRKTGLPTARHFTRLLRTIPNDTLQYLLGDTVRLLKEEMAMRDIRLGECISMDTKHILAFVKENNPKAYIKQDRFNKDRQPAGDPDCKLGCKRRHNRRASSKEPPEKTPTENPLPADTVSIGEFYWGYASGIVATKVPELGEIVLAELTMPFDQPDVAYFFPLMKMVEQRLGFKPRFGALDAAYDAWYTYQYFHAAGGFAAIPFSERGGYKDRKFTDEGAPFCQADLPMALRYTFTSRSGLIEHQAQRYVCPLIFPEPTGQACPKGLDLSCTSTLAAGEGSRLRYRLDRSSDEYKRIYSQRTATERIFSRAKAFGIERPRLRNGQAITNLNTLIYTLINLRILQRIHKSPRLSD